MSRHTYSEPLQHLVVPLNTMRCSSDAPMIERVLRRHPGVEEVYANPVTDRVHILYDAALTQPERLQAVLRQSGFGPRMAHAAREDRRCRPVDGSPLPRHRR